MIEETGLSNMAKTIRANLTDTKKMYHDLEEDIEKLRAKDEIKMPKLAAATASPHSGVAEQQYKQRKRKRSVYDTKEEAEERSNASYRRKEGKYHKPHYQMKGKNSVDGTGRKREHQVSLGKRIAERSAALSSEQARTDSENEGSDSGNDGSEDGEDSEGKSLDEEEQTESSEESSTSASEEEVKKKKKPRSVPHEEMNKELEEGKVVRKRKIKRVSGGAMESSKYDLHVSGKKLDESCNKKHRRESSISLTAIGISCPSTSQKEKKNQEATKKEGKRKKHVRKMKEKRERMRGRREMAPHPSSRDESSPECDMVKNKYKGEMKELVNIFERYFGQLCRVKFNPNDVAAELLKKGLISKAMMRDMVLSPKSQQARITLIDELDKTIKSHPGCLYELIEVMLENDALQETATEMLKEAGTPISSIMTYRGF